jgi:hypothetical protein
MTTYCFGHSTSRGFLLFEHGRSETDLFPLPIRRTRPVLSNRSLHLLTGTGPVSIEISLKICVKYNESKTSF